MSGEVRYLQGGADVEALVRAAGLVVDHAGVRTAVIGGLAVTCRLAVAHRATGDVDFVADEPEVVTEHAAVSNLVAAGVGTRDGSERHRPSHTRPLARAALAYQARMELQDRGDFSTFRPSRAERALQRVPPSPALEFGHWAYGIHVDRDNTARRSDSRRGANSRP